MNNCTSCLSRGFSYFFCPQNSTCMELPWPDIGDCTRMCPATPSPGSGGHATDDGGDSMTYTLVARGLLLLLILACFCLNMRRRFHRTFYTPIDPILPPPVIRYQTFQPQVSEDDVDFEPNGDEQPCVICLVKRRTFAFIPCGHRCICGGCHTKSAFDKCPVCRAPVTAAMKIFE